MPEHYHRIMRLKQWQKCTDWPLMILSIVFLVAFSWQVLVGAHLKLCEGLMNAIWIVFIVDYVVSLWLAEDKWQWFTHNLISLLSIVLPMFRPLRLLRLVKVLHVLGRTSGMAVRGKLTVYTIGSVSMLIYVSALAVYAVERGAEGSSITDFPTALWWAFVTATTVGYGDHTPVTVYGKLVAVGLMFTGIALIGMITAMPASWIVDQVNAEAEEREEEAQSETDRLRRDIRELTDTVAALREEIRGLRSPDASSSVPKPPSTPPIPSGL